MDERADLQVDTPLFAGREYRRFVLRADQTGEPDVAAGAHDAASMALGQYSSVSAAAAWCAQPGSGGRHSAARASRRAQVLGGQSVTVSSSATVPVRGR